LFDTAKNCLEEIQGSDGEGLLNSDAKVGTRFLSTNSGGSLQPDGVNLLNQSKNWRPRSRVYRWLYLVPEDGSSVSFGHVFSDSRIPKVFAGIEDIWEKVFHLEECHIGHRHSETIVFTRSRHDKSRSGADIFSGRYPVTTLWILWSVWLKWWNSQECWLLLWASSSTKKKRLDGRYCEGRNADQHGNPSSAHNLIKHTNAWEKPLYRRESDSLKRIKRN
jgi:hypothetical protein